MELLKPNYIDTTTALVVNTNTGTAENVMIPDITYQFYSSGFNNDNTTVSLRVNFQQTLTVSRLILRGHNWREFRAFYNGLTASAFALLNGPTTTSEWSSNSETSQFLTCTPVNCTSVTFEAKKTMIADVEKAIGYLVISQERYEFARIPAAKNYTPNLGAQEVVHRLSNGRTRIQNLGDSWDFEIKLDYISQAQRNELREIYDLHESHIYVPFGTATSWDGIVVPVVWPSPFQFYRYSDNAPDTGFEGLVRLLETDP
jgi:hypothetical protein